MYLTRSPSPRIARVLIIIVVSAGALLYFVRFAPRHPALASYAPASVPALGERQPHIMPLPTPRPYVPITHWMPSPTPTPHASPTPCDWCAMRAERYNHAVQSGFAHNQANVRMLPSLVQR